QASVFYTVYGGDEEREGTAAALASAKGRLRSLMGAQLGIRLTPTLEFHLDAVPETAATLDKALREARERDAELERMRATATFAGEEDPYRKPHVEADDATDDGERG
ncbi:MAG: ribosome-binding factor A, partial [Demequina sp.]